MKLSSTLKKSVALALLASAVMPSLAIHPYPAGDMDSAYRWKKCGDIWGYDTQHFQLCIWHKDPVREGDIKDGGL